MIDKMKWVEWNGSDILRCEKTHHHFAWITHHHFGYKVQLWDDYKGPQGDWVEIAIVPDLDAAKAIAKLNVEGELV